MARFQSWAAPFSLEQARAAVAAFAAGDPLSAGWFQWAIERTADRAHIGDLGLHRHENLMQAELGYTVAAEYQGQGYATEAVRGILGHLFRVEGLHKVSAECDARNTASARVLERAGFTSEGRRRSHTWIKNEWTDDLLYGVLAEDQAW